LRGLNAALARTHVKRMMCVNRSDDAIKRTAVPGQTIVQTHREEGT
jgi:hypothetical protein